MPPHGPGFAGATHSHSAEYPDDDWNLYAMIEDVKALNVTEQENAKLIFKPYVHRLEDTPNLVSDADQEMIVIVNFSSPVHISKLMVIGNGFENQHPAQIKCYVNRPDLDFTNISSYNPTQVFNLSLNSEENYGAENTCLKYIGLQGEHTHYRREAVHTTYELLCTGQDIIQPEGSINTCGHMH